MKKLMLSIIVLAFSAGALQAQDVSGSWQGTLNAGGRQLRAVVKISKDGGALKGMFYSIDQPGAAIATGTITVQDANVKIPIPGIGGGYEAKLNSVSEPNSMTGTFTQGPGSFQLTLTRATAETAWAIPDAPPPPTRMAANANPAFEVATIKPSKPGTPGKLFTVRGADVLTINTTLSDLITMAYGLHARQITGAPDWLESEKYDVTGRPDVPGQPSVDQMKTMIQKLLADRFQLKFHRDKKELSAYALTVNKTGSKLTPSAADPNALPGLFFSAPGRFTARNATMEAFAQVMQGTALDRPTVDQTGLSGKYDFTLNWTPDEFQFPGLRNPNGPPPPTPPTNSEFPDLYTAIQQQLGLKLESTKTPVEVLVIDRVEKPSEN